VPVAQQGIRNLLRTASEGLPGPFAFAIPAAAIHFRRTERLVLCGITTASCAPKLLVMESLDEESAAPSARKEHTHSEILTRAARIIRRAGYAGTPVADGMGAAGLTHDGFYAHFASKEDLLAQATDAAGEQSLARLAAIVYHGPKEMRYHRLVETLLADAHCRNIESGCLLAALATELPRQSAKVRSAASRHVAKLVDLIARTRPEGGPAAEEAALAALSAMLGALVIARAVDDPKVARRVLQATRRQMLGGQG
jgi:AcrR family transcriptional regulator